MKKDYALEKYITNGFRVNHIRNENGESHVKLKKEYQNCDVNVTIHSKDDEFYFFECEITGEEIEDRKLIRSDMFMHSEFLMTLLKTDGFKFEEYKSYNWEDCMNRKDSIFYIEGVSSITESESKVNWFYRNSLPTENHCNSMLLLNQLVLIASEINKDYPSREESAELYFYPYLADGKIRYDWCDKEKVFIPFFTNSLEGMKVFVRDNRQLVRDYLQSLQKL